MTFEDWAFKRWLSGAVEMDPAQQMVAKCAWDVATKQMQERFVEAVAAEREACAKVCDGLGNQPGWSYATKACADAIRARAIQWDEDRMDIIGPNGNDGLHYQEK